MLQKVRNMINKIKRYLFLFTIAACIAVPVSFSYIYYKNPSFYYPYYNKYFPHIKILKIRAFTDDTNAMYTLGYNYQHGYSHLNIDLKEAIKWYEMAIEHNDPKAMNSLGLIYKNGEGVKQDYKKAISLLKQSSDLNNKYALSNLAYMHLNGQGTEKIQTKP